MKLRYTVPLYPFLPVATAVFSVISLKVNLPIATGNFELIADVIVASVLSANSPKLPSGIIVDNSSSGSGSGVVSTTLTSIVTGASASSAVIVIFVVPTFLPVIVNSFVPETSAIVSSPETDLTFFNSEKLVMVTFAVLTPFKSNSSIVLGLTLITFLV